MTRSPKSISISHLQAAVTKALASAQKAHPQSKIELTGLTAGPAIIYRPWLCGYPIPWPWILNPGKPDPERSLDGLAAFNQTFVEHLAKDPSVASLAVNGKFEPAMHISGDQISVGFVPAETTIVE
jgi:hypothetical protein